MSFSNYEDLITNVADWIHRDDLTDRIPDFIQLAETRINRSLLSRQAETELARTATVGSRFIALPNDYKQPLGLWLTTYQVREEIVYRIPEKLVVSTNRNRPYHYTIDGGYIAFECPVDQAYTYAFRYKALYNLRNTSTNYILDTYPGLYLYGSLLEAAIYIRDQEQTQQFAEIFQKELDDAKMSEAENKDPSTLSVDPMLIGTGQFNINSGDYNGA
jgi:hypothetical protein